MVAAVRRMQAEQHNPKLGYNVLEDRYKDLGAAGIIDAPKVTRARRFKCRLDCRDDANH